MGTEVKKPAIHNPERVDAVPVTLYLTEFQAEFLYKTMEGNSESYKNNQSRQVQRRAMTAEKVEVAFAEVDELVTGIGSQMPKALKRRFGLK